MGIQLFLGKPPHHIEQVIIKRFLNEPLCFTAIDADATITFKKIGNPDEARIVTSVDKQNWQPYTFNTPITLTNIGDKVYFRATDENDISFYTDINNRYQFTTIASKKIAASGNIQTLMKADGSRLDISGKSQCYRAMFYECSALTTAPELPATTLADWCYTQMFTDCSSLTTAPVLPATILADRCYEYMFMDCSSLTSAPELPAMTLTNYCYAHMFDSCNKLTSVNVNFSVWNPSNATLEWLVDVASSGTFTCPAVLPDNRDESHIPIGWTRIEK